MRLTIFIMTGLISFSVLAQEKDSRERARDILQEFRDGKYVLNKALLQFEQILVFDGYKISPYVSVSKKPSALETVQFIKMYIYYRKPFPAPKGVESNKPGEWGTTLVTIEVNGRLIENDNQKTDHMISGFKTRTEFQSPLKPLDDAH